jgi:hypothetical protein
MGFYWFYFRDTVEQLGEVIKLRLGNTKDPLLGTVGILESNWRNVLQKTRHVLLMRRGVDGFSPSSWEPQEKGMMSTAASFSLSKKPRFVSLEKSQTPDGDAD